MIKNAIAASAVFAAITGAAPADTLTELRWNKRIVIVFADAGDERVAEQARNLRADEKALAERDLIAFAVVGGRIEPIYGDAPRGETAAELRARFNVAAAAPFTALLIGKDGGVKWRGSKPVTLTALNDTIDAMPMRQNESEK